MRREHHQKCPAKPDPISKRSHITAVTAFLGWTITGSTYKDWVFWKQSILYDNTVTDQHWSDFLYQLEELSKFPSVHSKSTCVTYDGRCQITTSSGANGNVVPGSWLGTPVLTCTFTLAVFMITRILKWEQQHSNSIERQQLIEM